MAHALPNSIDETEALLARGGYIAERDMATVLFLALKLKRPLFIEGEPGTETYFKLFDTIVGRLAGALK